MKILITEEQSRMLINHTISEQENITDKTQNEKLVSNERIIPPIKPKLKTTDNTKSNHQ